MALAAQMGAGVDPVGLPRDQAVKQPQPPKMKVRTPDTFFERGGGDVMGSCGSLLTLRGRFAEDNRLL
jgi:hypothetical protein